MLKILICSLLLLGMFFPQESKLDKMQGIWNDLRNGYDKNNEMSFLIMHANKSISIGYVEKDSALGFFMIETVKGFLDFNPLESEVMFKVGTLQNNGEYYVVCRNRFIQPDGTIHPAFCFTSNININDDLMVISNNGEQRYTKTTHLPSHANYLLYHRGKKEKKDYMRGYLDANVCELVFDSVQISPFGNDRNDTILKKGELVEILSFNDSMVLVNHVMRNDELIQGWLPVNAVGKTTFSRKVAVPKTYIYSTPEEKTKMYLIQNDEIELIEKVGDFWRMKYTTAKGKVIEGYVKRIDCW